MGRSRPGRPDRQGGGLRAAHRPRAEPEPGDALVRGGAVTRRAVCFFGLANELVSCPRNSLAFGRRCIPPGCVTPPRCISLIRLRRRALPGGRSAVLGATTNFWDRTLGCGCRGASRARIAPGVALALALL